jgi:hypothetical protein
MGSLAPIHFVLLAVLCLPVVVIVLLIRLLYNLGGKRDER